ncbi:MAG: formate dehydrogenase accessory sulfurtransferase FdhD [Planctomycetota bacterium]|nr:formate dehydrogenase accessory sulfurtransferase FdhD [Planctomycetota bacterium]
MTTPPREPVAGSSAVRGVRRIDAEGTREGDDRLAVEEPLEIRLGEEPLAVTMRTPGHDADLAAGFCLTEGVIAHPDELEAVEPCTEATHGNVIIVRLSDEALIRRATQIVAARRETYLSSSCGLCGKQTIDRIAQHVAPLRGGFTVAPALLDALPAAMRAAQSTFEQTGGLHAAALFTPTGELRVLREDIGRHNAVDKVIGWSVRLGRVPIDPMILLVSGRAGFEIVQKAAVAGIAFVASVSAPSSLAVDFAQAQGMTLAGFLRPGRVNIYAGGDRVREA